MKQSSDKLEELPSTKLGSGRFGGLVQPWAVGVAGASVLLILGLGAWSLQQSQGSNRPLHPLSASHHRAVHQVYEPAKQVSQPLHDASAENLEDVLSALEGGDSSAAHVPRKSLATSGSRTQKAQKKQQRADKRKELLDDHHEAKQPTAEEQEKAREVIRDTVKKLQEKQEKKSKKGKAKPKKSADELKADELQALLGVAPVPDAPEADAPDAVDDGAEAEDTSHLDFAKALQEEHDRKIHVELKTVKSEFKRDFGDNSRSLLCSGCKLVAARLNDELDTHDVHTSESPAHMIGNKRKAIDSTCSSLRHLAAVVEDGVAKFEASEVTGEGEREGKRLCAAILEESRFDLLARMIQKKVPEMSHVYGGGGESREKKLNMERWLCAERTRLCKRSEVRDEDDEEEEL